MRPAHGKLGESGILPACLSKPTPPIRGCVSVLDQLNSSASQVVDRPVETVVDLCMTLVSVFRGLSLSSLSLIPSIRLVSPSGNKRNNNKSKRLVQTGIYSIPRCDTRVYHLYLELYQQLLLGLKTELPYTISGRDSHLPSYSRPKQDIRPILQGISLI